VVLGEGGGREPARGQRQILFFDFSAPGVCFLEKRMRTLDPQPSPAGMESCRWPEVLKKKKLPLAT
jgi:hypothetical protein